MASFSEKIARPFSNVSFSWYWFFQRLPIIILSLESANGVYQYLRLTATSEFVSLLGAGAFDTVFIGLVAFSDHIREIEVDENGKLVLKRERLFWCLNIAALLFAFAFGLLAHSDGNYANVTLETFTRAFAFPFLSLLYTLFFDAKVQQIKYERIKDERAANDARIQKEKERAAYLLAYPLYCDYCGERFTRADWRRRNGHVSQCKRKKVDPL